MFELKTNEDIGVYLKELILSKYPSCRQFCIAYLQLQGYDDNQEEIRKLTNRLSQILHGKKAIQTYDLPIFSELLGVSCEEMLSAGAVRKPLLNRRTNYNIAFSKDKNDWIDYLNREDCIAAYADEFGKTVVDYAIEFKNYGFLKFLVEQGYITLVKPDESMQELDFGASTTLKERPHEHHTFKEELYTNKLLRTQLIALALESNDDTVLKELRAREVPTQLTMTTYDCPSVSFKEYYDEHFIDVILRSKEKVLYYFCEEYYLASKWEKREFKWIFPFFDKLIERAVAQKNVRADTLLEIAIKHNEDAYNTLKKSVFATVKEFRKCFGKSRGFLDVLNDVLRNFCVNNEGNVFAFNCYGVQNSEVVATNIIKVGVDSDNPDIQKKIDKLNSVYSQIVDIKNHLIKQ